MGNENQDFGFGYFTLTHLLDIQVEILSRMCLEQMVEFKGDIQAGVYIWEYYLYIDDMYEVWQL